MLVYRITKQKYAADLTGRGAAIAGGRWNRKGLPALYTAESRSLAILELLVHCGRIDDVYGRLVQTIEVMDSPAAVITTDMLSNEWRAVPWKDETVKMGSAWLSGNENLVMQLPSAIVPAENNYLINPAHPEYSKVRIVGEEILNLDPRIAALLS